MNSIVNLANIENLINYIILAVIVIAVTIFITLLIIKKLNVNKPKKNIPLTSGQQSFWFNEPIYSKDKLLGRDIAFDKTIGKIINGIQNIHKENHFAILGSEGIGKTLFCQWLFKKLKTERICLGWIECNGKQSIYDIIKTNFKGFSGKSKEEILAIIESLPSPFILFIDQINLNQNTDISEIEEIAECDKVSVIISGSLKNEQLYFIRSNRRKILSPLKENDIKTIFEKKSRESIIDMGENERKAVQTIISMYINGNPYLAGHFATAKKHGYKTWQDVLKSVSNKKYDNGNIDYVTKVFNELYKIDNLRNDEKEALSKLSIFSSLKFVNDVFIWNKITTNCIAQLNKTYWLENDHDLLYYRMDENHKDAVRKVLGTSGYEKYLKELIVSITDYIYDWDAMEDKGFEEISYYVEDILKNIKGYAPDIMNERYIMDPFAYIIARHYHHSLKNNEKAWEWLGYCNPVQFEIILPDGIDHTACLPKSSQRHLIYEKAVLEMFIKMDMFENPSESEEVEQVYLDALSIAEGFDDCLERQRNLQQNYFEYLNRIGRYEIVKSYCKNYFDASGFYFHDGYNCDLFFRYLCAAEGSDDENLLNILTTDEIISKLWNNNECSITVAWSYRNLYQIFLERGDNIRLELCKERMVILINRERCFWSNDIKGYFKSKEEFIEYMHSNDELKISLKEALEREDADAFYLEGRYQEAKGDAFYLEGKFQEAEDNYKKASNLYEKSMNKDNAKGICSLGLMYYQGKGKIKDYDKACECWKYAADRGHKGSYYWQGILLLDENYDGRGFSDELREENISKEELAFKYLIEAANMGSKRAQNLLSSLDNESQEMYLKLAKANPKIIIPFIVDSLKPDEDSEFKRQLEEINSSTQDTSTTTITNIPFEAYKGDAPYIFVSYAHKDAERVFPIISKFHKSGFPIWYDEGISPGYEWRQEIRDAILGCTLFIVFTSISAEESKEVRKEIHFAESNKKPIIPICLEEIKRDSSLAMALGAYQGIMQFEMKEEVFYRKCLQSFESFGIKR
jgi:hypothetical protein